MISDDELDALPDDDLEAFVAFEAVVNRNLDGTRAEGWDAEREYVAYILAFLEERQIDLVIPNSPPAADEEFGAFFEVFRRKIEAYRAKVRLALAAQRRTGGTSFSISVSFKTQIGGHLTAIRAIVQKAEMSESKRDAIYKRIEKLQSEVDRDRTKTEVVTGLWLDITSAIGSGAKNLDPAIERLEKIMRVLGDARNDTPQLPAPTERKRIPAPNRPSESDDEIPF